MPNRGIYSYVPAGRKVNRGDCQNGVFTVTNEANNNVILSFLGTVGGAAVSCIPFAAFFGIGYGICVASIAAAAAAIAAGTLMMIAQDHARADRVCDIEYAEQ